MKETAHTFYSNRIIKLIAVGLSLALSSAIVNGQNKYLDSLELVFKSENVDSARVVRGIYYAHRISRDGLEKAEKILFELREFCLRNGVVTLYPKISVELGILNYDKGRYIESIVYLERGLREICHPELVEG